MSQKGKSVFIGSVAFLLFAMLRDIVPFRNMVFFVGYVFTNFPHKCTLYCNFLHRIIRTILKKVNKARMLSHTERLW